MKTLRSWAAVLCVTALLAPPLDAHTKAGDKLLKKGEKAEEQHDYDAALTFYEQALETDSREPAYLVAEGRVKPLASSAHLDHGKKLLAQQKLDEALVQFQKALLTDPSSSIALQMILQATQMIKERNKAPAGTVILTPAEQAHQDLEKRLGLLQGPPTLKPITNLISSLKINNQPARVLYESVGKLAGINVLFDPQGIEGTGAGGGGGGGTARNFNLELTNVTLEEALNDVSLTTHTFWKAISRNAIFVTSESQTKRQEYQDEVVRVFYVQNASTAAEFTEIFNAVRTGAKLTTGVFQVASQNAIIARGSPDTMAIVEKLVHDLDRPKAEVLVDVMVMEIQKSKVSNIGAALQGSTLGGSAATGLAFPITPGTTTTSTGTTGTATTTTTGTSTALSNIGKLSTNQFSVALPSAIVEAFLSDSTTRLLDRPQIRVTDGGKAQLKVGSKIPYVSGSLNSAVATPGSIPYATTQFQQIDVGVNIDLQPHVNGPQDISMHIKVEVSSVTSTETIGGIQQPIIGQKVSEADLRMVDGEASLLGGVTEDSDTVAIAGIPGIANVPILGYLFGTRSKDREKDDIVIALIPHIIRAPVVSVGDEGILAGTESIVKVDRKSPETPAAVPALSPAPAAPILGQPAAGQPPGGQPSAQPAGQPAGQPPTPPTQLPPLGRALDLPLGVTPAQNTASGAWIADGSNPLKTQQPILGNRRSVPATAPPTNGSVELYLTPKPSGTAPPQPAPSQTPAAEDPSSSSPPLALNLLPELFAGETAIN